MKVVYTEQSLIGLEEVLIFLIDEQKLPVDKVIEIKTRLLDLVDSLKAHAQLGQIEEYLKHLDQGHRRLVTKYFKIIYKIEGETVYITDFFDTRQNPNKMKG